MFPSKVDPLPLDHDRAPADLVEDCDEVLADQSEKEQLQTAKEKQSNDDGCDSVRTHVESGKLEEQNRKGIQEADQRDGEPKKKRDSQRRASEKDRDTFQG